MLVGTISAIADGTLTLSLADGTTADVLTDEATTFWQETPATADELMPGATVRVRPSFGGPAGPGGGDPAAGPLIATRVTVVDDDASGRTAS